jgi:DNA-binding SARP family transcriptional activator/tetratricopeptide (TPR) repeat protein
MRFLILGPLEVRDEERPVALGGIKLRALLAVLLLHANEAVSAERIALALWGDEATTGASKTVQAHVWRLRKALGDRELIATTPAGYCLRVDPDELDATQFERLVHEGSGALAGGQPERAAALLHEALALWRGPALGELAHEPFARNEITRLEEQRLAALETRVEADMAVGRHGDLVAELRHLVAAHPTRERLTGQLMLALYRCGRQTDALQAYRDARTVLVADVGVEPGPRLRELHEAILRHDVATQPPVGALAPLRAGVRFNVPAVAASFVGREEELDALDDALGVADRVVVTQAITGLGGVGKSQLAARYVQQRTDGYDVVAWICAEDGGIADLARLAAKLGEPVAELSPSEAAQLALEWLSDSEQRWLLVLDNVESVEQLDGLRLRTGNGRVLVTSRDRTLRQFGPVLTVDVFDEDTATAYLSDRAGRPGDEPSARQLARGLGCLPLALSHAAAFCDRGTSFADYLQLLDELPARDLFDSQPELSYEQTIASTWRASIRAASKAAPLAINVLEMAAYMGPDAVPKSLFRVLIDPDAPLARKRFADALNALARFSLATVDDTTVSVHRLLQKTIRDDATARNDHTAAMHALAALIDAFPDDVRWPANWPLCEQLLPHAFALVDSLLQPGDAGPQLIDLLNRATDYLCRAEPGQRGLAIARTALRHAERILGAEHPNTLTSRNRLATAYLCIGCPAEAITMYEPLLADRERIDGPEHLETFTARHHLALAYLAAGRVGEAIAIFEPLLAGCERVLGNEHPDTLRTRNNLGRAYLDAKRVSEAIAILEPLLPHRERVLGSEHPDALRTRNNLGRAYLAAGRVGEAIAIFEPLLADRERILGTEHPDTLNTRNNLAGAYEAAGRTLRRAAPPPAPPRLDYQHHGVRTGMKGSGAPR